MVSEFERDLAALLNKHGIDNLTNTPDFILAAYVNDCLASYRRIHVWNRMWHSEQGVPIPFQVTGPPMMRR